MRFYLIENRTGHRIQRSVQEIRVARWLTRHGAGR